MCGDFTGEDTFVKRPKASSKCLFGDCYRLWANSVVKPMRRKKARECGPFMGDAACGPHRRLMVPKWIQMAE
jgi:hypothetical protein